MLPNCMFHRWRHLNLTLFQVLELDDTVCKHTFHVHAIAAIWNSQTKQTGRHVANHNERNHLVLKPVTVGVYGDKLLGLKDSGPNEQLSLAALKMLVRRSERQKIPKHNSTRTKPPVSHQTLHSSLFFEK